MDQECYFDFIREEANHEIGRLKTLLRDPCISEDERRVVLAMLEFYEDPKMDRRGTICAFIGKSDSALNKGHICK
jgi:hypothetical protein